MGGCHQDAILPASHHLCHACNKINVLREPSSYVWCLASAGRPRKGVQEGDRERAAVTPAFIGRNTGSLGLGLAFGWRCLGRPLQRCQLVIEPVLTGTEPFLHQLFELPQFLAQLGLDVGSEESDLAYRGRKERVGLRLSLYPLAGQTLLPRGPWGLSMASVQKTSASPSGRGGPCVLVTDAELLLCVTT